MPQSKSTKEGGFVRLATGASAALAVAVVLAWTIPADAAQTDAEIACRAMIAKSLGKYVKTADKAVVGCHKLRDRGKLPAGTNCNDLSIADAKAKLPAAAAKAGAGIGTACASVPTVLGEFGRCPAPFQTVDDGAATTGIDDTVELTDCLTAHARHLVETTAQKIMASPAAPLPAALAKCHGALGKAYTKYIDTIVKARAKCQTASDKSGGPLGFGCVLDDPSGVIAKARSKGVAAIDKACADAAVASISVHATARAAASRGVPDLGSCAVDVSGLKICALDTSADTAGTGMAAMMWELPGICPASGSYVVVPAAASTELDVGWTGLGHDMDPILGYRGVQITVTCDADCANCASSTIAPSPDACRCSGGGGANADKICSNDADCGVDAPCTCYYGPPTPYSAGGAPACVQSEINGAVSGSLNPATGDLVLDIPLRHKIYTGQSITSPCPRCATGTCDGGARVGQPCAVDATDTTFGSVSYDCPPFFGANISGTGIETAVHYTTGSASLPFGTQCDSFFLAFSCACGVCSLDPTRTCNSDAECAGVGLCTNGYGPPRQPNSCDDLNCSPDVETGEGTCSAGPTDTFCDGFVARNGAGIIPCLNDFDCDAYSTVCPGGYCGTCVLSKNRDCFLDPIVAMGSPGQTMVGTGCIGAATSGAVNNALGWPGPYRVKQGLDVELLCSDGVTPFAPPGGSTCP